MSAPVIVPYPMAVIARHRREAAVRRSWALRAFVAQEHPGWRTSAACRGRADLFHRGNGHLAQARLVCDGCPVRMDCLAACRKAEAAIDARYWHGVYGGLSANERRDVAYVEVRFQRKAGMA